MDTNEAWSVFGDVAVNNDHMTRDYTQSSVASVIKAAYDLLGDDELMDQLEQERLTRIQKRHHRKRGNAVPNA